jgi:hypothetical protein
MPKKGRQRNTTGDWLGTVAVAAWAQRRRAVGRWGVGRRRIELRAETAERAPRTAHGEPQRSARRGSRADERITVIQHTNSVSNSKQRINSDHLAWYLASYTSDDERNLYPFTTFIIII